ncbi:hypothetical protein [Streptosporangium lutulentum]|uniref:Uncharacterized protein n=1 Tax=Streptosporangium lutulentum TaxID=1461250 RepID=A0ABT9Q3Q9_9ACTN|nr:hypothetical protein [Streptosporangium lutulentum]MDP9841365.1 hypothetical protein [Streptosporangium lutulentum]
MPVAARDQEVGTATAYQVAPLSQRRVRSYANQLTGGRVIQAITGENTVPAPAGI